MGFVAASIGPQAEQAVAAMQEGDVLMLENLRFHEGEEAGDADLPPDWHDWPISTSMTPFRYRTAAMPQWSVLPGCCLPVPGR